MVDNEFQGQVALITGGGGGLGSEAAHVLARDGAHIVLADLSLDSANRVADRLKSEGLSAQGLALDVTDSAAVDQAIESIVREHGRLDILVASHGFARDGQLVMDMTDEDWSAVIDVCLTGTFYAVRAATRAMIQREYGRIITLSSRAWHGNPGQASYSGAKAGVVGLTRAVAKEVGRKGITVNALAPGLIETESLHKLKKYDAVVERAIKDNSIKRIGLPEDVAGAVRFLSSSASSFITGEVIHVSGGRFG